jgi:hypothetical protein
MYIEALLPINLISNINSFRLVTMAKGKRQTIQWPKEKDRQYNEQKKKTNNGKQNTTQKTKD